MDLRTAVFIILVGSVLTRVPPQAVQEDRSQEKYALDLLNARLLSLTSIRGILIKGKSCSENNFSLMRSITCSILLRNAEGKISRSTKRVKLRDFALSAILTFLKIVMFFIFMISERALEPPADHVQTLQEGLNGV